MMERFKGKCETVFDYLVCEGRCSSSGNTLPEEKEEKIKDVIAPYIKFEKSENNNYEKFDHVDRWSVETKWREKGKNLPLRERTVCWLLAKYANKRMREDYNGRPAKFEEAAGTYDPLGQRVQIHVDWLKGRVGEHSVVIAREFSKLDFTNNPDGEWDDEKKRFDTGCVRIESEDVDQAIKFVEAAENGE